MEYNPSKVLGMYYDAFRTSDSVGASALLAKHGFTHLVDTCDLRMADTLVIYFKIKCYEYLPYDFCTSFPQVNLETLEILLVIPTEDARRVYTQSLGRTIK